MPEFQRSWRDWEAENLPADTRDGTDKTDKSAFVSFVSPIEEPPAEIHDDVEPSAPAENLPAGARDRTDETDKSASDALDGPREGPSDSEAESKIEPLAEPCLVPACRFTGYIVELGSGLTTRLCAVHRRELFKLARELFSDGDDHRIFAPRPCRFCGQSVQPEDDPCRQCTAARSPLVQTALQMGAKPLCACGSAVERPGDVCEECRRDQP